MATHSRQEHRMSSGAMIVILVGLITLSPVIAGALGFLARGALGGD